MLASVITVVFNGENDISRTIESVLKQTSKDFEYIIIDGASTDNTLKIINSYVQKFVDNGFKKPIIISEKDNGIYDAMNKGAKIATGEYIGFINAGDWYEPEIIETLENAYRRDKFDMFFADMKVVKKNGDVIVKHSRFDNIVTSRHWNHPTSFTKKSVFDELGGYLVDGGIYSDFEMYLRFRHLNKKIHIEHKVLANFSIGGISNKKTIEACINRIKERYRDYRKNGYNPMYIFECLYIELGKMILA